MVVPYLEQLIALIGAVASSFLALILPAIIHMITLCGEPGPPSRRLIIKDAVIAIVGIIGFVTGTYTAVLDLVAAWNS